MSDLKPFWGPCMNDLKPFGLLRNDLGPVKALLSFSREEVAGESKEASKKNPYFFLATPGSPWFLPG